MLKQKKNQKPLSNLQEKSLMKPTGLLGLNDKLDWDINTCDEPDWEFFAKR